VQGPVPPRTPAPDSLGACLSVVVAPYLRDPKQAYEVVLAVLEAWSRFQAEKR
jgi:hypothetical protein